MGDFNPRRKDIGPVTDIRRSRVGQTRNRLLPCCYGSSREHGLRVVNYYYYYYYYHDYYYYCYYYYYYGSDRRRTRVRNRTSHARVGSR